MQVNSFGEKHIKKNITKLMMALFCSTDVDLCLLLVLARKEFEKRHLKEDDLKLIENLITKQGK